MKIFSFGLFLGLLVGSMLMVALFYDGYHITPKLSWGWSLRDDTKNCLRWGTQVSKTTGEFDDLICVRNGYDPEGD